jgi:hypothetical protein
MLPFVQNLVYSRLLSKNVKSRLVLYGCETWSLILKVAHRLKVVEDRMLRKIFDRRGMK